MANEGAEPVSGLVRGADNLLYGTASTGGEPSRVDTPPPVGAGTIYRVSIDGTFEVIYTFTTALPQFCLHPAGLIRGRDKHLYGTTDYGGTLDGDVIVDGAGTPVGDGVIYRLNWDEGAQTYSGITVLHTFDCSKGEGGDPWVPWSKGRTEHSME